MLGANESLILTTFGTVGLALGLALQDVLKSFFAGLYLLVERPFGLGDELQIKEYRGKIEAIGLRTTALRTTDNTRVLVPNAVVFSEIVLNRSESKAEPVETVVAASAQTKGIDPAGPRQADSSRRVTRRGRAAR